MPTGMAKRRYEPPFQQEMPQKAARVVMPHNRRHAEPIAASPSRQKAGRPGMPESLHRMLAKNMFDERSSVVPPCFFPSFFIMAAAGTFAATAERSPPPTRVDTLLHLRPIPRYSDDGCATHRRPETPATSSTPRLCPSFQNSRRNASNLSARR